MRETSNSLSKQNSQQPKHFRGGEKKVMKKSLLALVLAFSLVLSVAGSAFAATPSDVVGKKEQSAIEELVALGIINGYADGTFKPENKITRAELAKIVVEATGSGSAATLMQTVKPTFKDVKVNEWYTGYINVAATKGFILGDKGTGKFRPNDNIKFEEVVAIVTRALGYQDAKLQGSWPYNVLVKAEDLGLFSKVEITPGTLATRAIVAQVTSNALQQELVAYNADGDQYFVTKLNDDGSTYSRVKLITKLGKSVASVLTNSALDSNGKVELNDAWTTTSSKFIVTGGKKLSQLVGHEVVALLDKDGKVLALTDAQPADRTVAGKLDAVPATTGADASKIFVKVGDDKKEYTINTVASNTYGVTDFFKNGDVVSVANRGTIASGASVDVLLNKDGSVRALVAKEYAPVNALYVGYVAKTSSNDARITHTGGYSVVNDNTVYTINGEVKAVTDLAADDVLEVVRNAKQVASEVNATRNVVTGKVTAVTKVNADTFYTVNGEQYKEAIGGLALKNGTEYKLFLNKDKGIVKATVVTPGAADNNLAIVLGYNTGDNGQGAQVIVDGVVVKRNVLKYYSVKEDKIVTVNLPAVGQAGNTDIGNVVVGEFAKLKFDGATVTGIDGAPKGNVLGTTTVAEKSDTSVKIGNSTYNINGSTVVLDATKVVENNAVKSDAKITKGDIARVTKNDIAFAVTDDSGYNAAYIVLVKDLEAAEKALPTIAGKYLAVTKVTNDNVSDSVYKVKLSVNGNDKEVEVKENVYLALAAKNADNNVIVKLASILDGNGNPVSSKYDGLTVVYEKNSTTGLINNFTAASQTYNTFVADNLNYVLTAESSVVVIDANNNVKFGSIADVVTAQLTDDQGDNAYSVFVSNTGKEFGVNKEVAVVVIKKG
ncbi:S-layer homology domain-containing protein [Paenibacillus sp. NPDC058174]|uniref:S-layer homology domain-containing protein n=1 Tax=Paenibacillus sp. NPDC058174 TaxID=3346366 RepID=UPI0036DA411B